MAYADYDFYVNVYLGDSIREEDFPRLAERASDYVYGVTQGLVERVQSRRGRTAVQKAVCAAAEALQDESVRNSQVFSEGLSLSSETVAEWTRSYSKPSITAAETEYLQRRRLDALQLYLSGVPELAGLFKVRSFPCVHKKR